MLPILIFFPLWTLVIVTLAVRAIIVYRPGGIEAWRVRRRHERTATTAIADLPEDQLGQITGQVSATEPLLTAPLSGRPCVYYALVVVHRCNRRWDVIVDERRGPSFAITDRTGRAIIDPSNAQLAMYFHRVERTGWLDRITPEQKAILVRHGIPSDGWFFPRTLRFQEAIIEVGNHISVIGAGIREPGDPGRGETDYRSSAPTQLRVANSAAAPLSLLQPSLR